MEGPRKEELALQQREVLGEPVVVEMDQLACMEESVGSKAAVKEARKRDVEKVEAWARAASAIARLADTDMVNTSNMADEYSSNVVAKKPVRVPL